MRASNTNRMNRLSRFCRTGVGIVAGFLCMSLFTNNLQGMNLTGTLLYAQQLQQETDLAEFYVFNMEDENPRVSVSVENMLLVDLLHQLAKELDVDISINTRLIADRTVSYRSQNKFASDVLYDLLENTGLEVSLSDDRKVLIIRENETSVAPLEVQATPVSGTVTDAATGETLPGVNVIIKNSFTGIATDANGEYELSVPSPSDTLVFSFLGYQTLEIPIDGRTEVNAEMQSQAITGEEVVVVGYGEQRRRDITSSIASISAEDFENEPSQQIAQSLQGRVSGVQIMQDSGNPGSSFMMRIRGVGSVNDRANAPLYVVDGNPLVDPSDISPSQIENIQILKSASASAIYGARGANGVVLITTKRGREGQFLVDLSMYRGTQFARRMPLVNASEYAMLYNEASTTGGNAPIFTNPDQFGEGTNWQDEMYRPAVIQDLQLSLSGGNDVSTYYISGNYFNQEGVIRTTVYDRLNLRLNTTHQVTDFLQLGQNLSVSRAEYSQINPYGMGGIINNVLGLDPTVPVMNDDGSWGMLPRGGNVAAQFERIENSNNGTERPVLNGNIFAELNPIESLSFRTQYNMDYGSTRSRNFSPTYFISTVDENPQSSLSRNITTWTNWNWENTLTYTGTYGAHNLTALVGFTAQENSIEFLNASANDLPVNSDIFEGLRYFNLADTGQNVGGSGSAFGMVSYLGRINYDYNQTYLATINYRVDGSSRFGQNNRYGYFPSFSAGWRISNEAFMEDVAFVDDLMIRAGWGQLGNQESLSNYAFTSSVSTGLDYYFGQNGRTLFNGQAPTGMGNPNLRWEALEETNIGLTFTGFDHKVTVEMDYYDRTTSDMLIQVPVIAYSGIQDPAFQNAGEVVNRGFELTVGYQRTLPGDFYYNVSANMSYNTNEVTELSEGTSEILGGWISFIGENYTTRAVVGQPLGVFYGYKTDGIFQNQQEVEAHATQAGAAPGDLRFRDLNNDGAISSDDQTYIGNPWPSQTFGLSADFAYKNFDLNISFQGVYGNEIFSAWKWYYYGGNWFNYHEDALNRWTTGGQNTDIPRLNINDPNSNLRNSDWYVEDGSYLRLNNLQLGYTVPGTALNIRRFRIYMAATNLFTITGYPGVDPELGTSENVSFGAPLFVGIDSGHYPVPRTVTLGINIGL